jgi:RNA polymerase sigma-70 factor (ECF subfamily)
MSENLPQDAFEKLFKEQYARLVNASFRLCGDQSLAEDVVQNVFLKFYEQNGLQKAEKPGAYLRRAVVTRTINAIRDRKRIAHPGDEALTSAVEQFPAESNPDLADVKMRLHSAIAQLPERARVILLLHRFEGLSYKEIANELDIAPKTVENQLARALKLLRTYLPKTLGILLAINSLVSWGFILIQVSLT